jgi:hypothetical protein
MNTGGSDCAEGTGKGKGILCPIRRQLQEAGDGLGHFELVHTEAEAELSSSGMCDYPDASAVQCALSMADARRVCVCVCVCVCV